MSRTHTRSDARRFPSRIDAWLVVLMIAADVLAITACIPAIVAGVPAVAAIMVFSLVIIVGLPAWLFLATHYTFEGDTLTVRSGPFRWQVPLERVTAVTPTRNPLSSPALSLDRLRIDYGNGKRIMISPRDKAGFLRELESRRSGGKP